MSKRALIVASTALAAACSDAGQIIDATVLETASPTTVGYTVTGSTTKVLQFDVDNPGNYASVSVYADDELLLDRLNVPTAGQQVLSALVRFRQLGDVQLTIKVNNADLTLNSLSVEDVEGLDIPVYRDASIDAGLDKVRSIKYGGPTIADIDNDGDYDLIVNNHNAESSKLYWNNGDGTVRRHDMNLSRWFMHDLHGTAAGDFDNDGDLDIVVTQGGGNGQNPSTANFYKNDDGTLVLFTGDVGIEHGGRGRGAKWFDMDTDGDLDLMLVNETALIGKTPQHYFYENSGDGKFRIKDVDGLQNQHPSRALITDINNDTIDDVILYGPLSVWQGNGDFSFTEVTSQLPDSLTNMTGVMAIADVDIDNDGDLDLYLARGKEFEGGFGEAPSLDHDPLSGELAIKPRGYKDVDTFDFSASGSLRFHKYNFQPQPAFRSKDYPIFLGSEKTAVVMASGEEMDIHPEMATGWPEKTEENGIYFGYLGERQWKAALVRNDNIFWSFKFSLSGVDDVTPGFIPENRNIADVLLRNDNGSFTDVSEEWRIPTGGNSLGVTVGDFNNDSHQDIFVYRWGLIASRISDYMLLNDGAGHFKTVTMHGASDVGGPGNGDMGQAFDFDLDGDIDLLSGSEDGEWYLYRNEQAGDGNYALVRVGYSPQSNVDPISAHVVVRTSSNEYRKRVGSAGAVFSQSLLNIVHFGLGDEDAIDSIEVQWRNGERLIFTDKLANTLFDTDRADPQSLHFDSADIAVRQGTSVVLNPVIEPANADSSIAWSSSDETVVAVNDLGHITALGDIGSTATITATSAANGTLATCQVSVVEWYALPVQTVSLQSDAVRLIEGQTSTFSATVSPRNADNANLAWLSSDPAVASVDASGRVSAVSAGTATIRAESVSEESIGSEIQLTVEPFVEPFIRITNEESLRSGALVVGDDLVLNVEYHAGSGNTVISSDEGGMRFWLRHFRSKWFPVRDIVRTDPRVLGTLSGSSSMSLSLDGLTPTAELPAGHFYQLRVSFASSDGKFHDASIYPLNVVAAEPD